MAELGSQLSIQRDDAGFVLVGEIDAHTAPDLEQAISDRLESGEASVRLAMGDVSFMDSSGLRVVIAATEATRERGGDLVIFSPGSTVARLIEVSGLDGHLSVESG